MRSNKKTIIVLITIGFVLLIAGNLIGNNSNKTDNQSANVENSSKVNVIEPTMAGSYTPAFILIDGSIPNNWSDTASNYPWCNEKDGVYYIENCTIDANDSPTGSGILIENSINIYFVVRNCTVSNAKTEDYDAGIRLENTCNGTIINNKCLNNNKNGISLHTICLNNTIANNTANDNNGYGIYIEDGCDENIIANNTANHNIDYGIYIDYYCNGNTIANNTANNGYNGIYLYDNCNGNTIANNTANHNDNSGIYLYDNCNGNNITNNNANDNTQDGIRLFSNCNGNTLTHNTANNNTQNGIYLQDSNNTVISENIASFNDKNGIYLENSNNTRIINNAGTFANNTICGIFLLNSHWNNITNNIANYNGIYGICLNSSNNNKILNNEFIGNLIPFYNDTNCAGNIFDGNIVSRPTPISPALLGDDDDDDDDDGEGGAIPGYNLFIVLSAIFAVIIVFSILLIKKQLN